MIPEIGETWELTYTGIDGSRIVILVYQDDHFFHALEVDNGQVHTKFHRRDQPMPMGWKKLS